ncbi:MAG: hypothetical protein A2284_05250 [Deltaproteobacteria bacterium RIFOXYA12_FULL_61_11]|nr:MAG: hypothetical protein A2284_05250 [Deltaproteobacteria bacterium RIFOXYA12_FULL_61_11]
MRTTILLAASLFLFGIANATPCHLAVDQLHDAMAICQHEIKDATSGQYSNYRSVTVRSILDTIAGHALAAGRYEPALRPSLDQFLEEVAQERTDTFRYQYYRLSTVVMTMGAYKIYLGKVVSQIQCGE